MQVSIETAKIEDYKDIARLINNVLGYSETTPDEVKEMLQRMTADENYETYVAKSESKTLGFMGICKNLTYEMKGEVVRIIAFAVDHTCQRTGIGAQLLARAEQYAKENSISYITLTSGMHRAGAHLFYERNGYEKKGFNFKKLIQTD